MAALLDVSVDRILVARRAALEAGGGRWQGLLPSVVLHVVLAGTLVVSPLIQLRKRDPIEFIPVQLVPAQALGVTRPAPAKPQPAHDQETVCFRTWCDVHAHVPALRMAQSRREGAST